MKLNINISPCPNDTFMFDALINGRIDTEGMEFDVRFEDIENLNTRALNTSADICKISYAILAQLTEHYMVLGSGSALGYANGPLLIAREKIDLNRTDLRVVVPGEHTTANLLMNKIFPQIINKKCMLFSEIANAVVDGKYDAGVLIHEGRFTYADKGLQLVADLGYEWEKISSLPLPLGAIIISNRLSDKTRQKFNRLLRKSVEYAMANPEISRPFIKAHAQELEDQVIDSHIEMFVNKFSVSLGSQGRKAVGQLTGVTDISNFVL